MDQPGVPKNPPSGIRTSPLIKPQPAKRSRQSEDKSNLLEHERTGKIMVTDELRQIQTQLNDALAAGDRQTEGRIPATLTHIETELATVKEQMAAQNALLQVILSYLLSISVAEQASTKK